MALAIGAVERKRGAPVVAVAALATFVVAHAWWASRFPLIDVGLAIVAAVLICPPLARAALIVMVALGPTLNPPVLGIGTGGGGGGGGRVYLVQAGLLLLAVAALAWGAINGLQGRAALIVGVTALLVVVGTVGRSDAGAAWVYRPLQLFLVAFTVRSLFMDRGRRALLLALAWGGAVGCALATIHSLVPAIDPFALSRPDDLPFVSTIGNFARATGAFTYPNNLGTFAAYMIVLGAAALMLGRPVLPRPLAMFAVAAGLPALMLSGSRAAGLGCLCAVLYLTFKASPRRRALILFVQGVVGLSLALAVLSAPSATEVAAERVQSAAGSSLVLRVGSWSKAIESFLESPVIGTGAADNRTDNFWLLYLSQGGIVGAVLLVILARGSLRHGDRPKSYPELWVALLLVLCVSGTLQDSLGQTLTTWFPGALLGLAVLPPPQASAVSEESEDSLAA